MNLFGISLPMTVEQLRRVQQTLRAQLRDGRDSLPDVHGDWSVRGSPWPPSFLKLEVPS